MDRDTRDMLLETADRFFTQRCGREVVNGVEKGAWPADLWKEIEEMGLPLIAVPEDKGGVGGTLAVVRAMQMAGAADKVLATAVEYSKQRVQFGRSISTFQAIQHMLAELASCVAATIASAEAAARDADEGGLLDGGRFSIAAAKSQASDFAQRIAAISHQSMGAMGFTHEHILHHYTRRLWVWRRDVCSEV